MRSNIIAYSLNHGRAMIFGFFLALCCVLTGYDLVYPQAGTSTAVGITCPASGSSVQVQSIAPSRMSYAVLNDSGVDVRVGFVSSGTPNLDDTNSYILKAGQSTADAIPGTYYGRVVCMSTTGVAQIIHTTQATR